MRDRLTGEVAEPIFGGDDKLATLIELRERLGLAPEETWRSATAPTTSP